MCRLRLSATATTFNILPLIRIVFGEISMSIQFELQIFYQSSQSIDNKFPKRIFCDDGDFTCMRVCGLPRGTTKRQGWAEEEPWRPRWLSKQYSTVLNSRYKVLSAKIWASSMETVTECWQRVKTRSTGEMQYFKHHTYIHIKAS